MTSTYGEPTYDRRDWTLPRAEQEPTAVRWDLAFGACLSFGPQDYTGQHTVRLNLSDQVLADRGLLRNVTPEQIRTFAKQLLLMLDAEHAARQCRTDGHLGVDTTAVALVDGDPRCAMCLRVTEEVGPVERQPLPWAQEVAAG